MKRLTRREWVLLAAVPALILAAAAAEQEQGDPQDAAGIAEVARVVKTKGEAKPAVVADELDLAQLRRAPKPDEPANLFETKSWYVPPPPPPPAKPAPPPPPTAPPLPFTYLGQYQDSAKPVIFLVRGNRVLTVSAGDVIEGTYRVDGIVGRILSLTYLPLNIRQTLDTGSAG